MSSPHKESLSHFFGQTGVAFRNPPVAISTHQSPPQIDLHCWRCSRIFPQRLLELHWKVCQTVVCKMFRRLQIGIHGALKTDFHFTKHLFARVMRLAIASFALLSSLTMYPTKFRTFSHIANSPFTCRDQFSTRGKIVLSAPTVRSVDSRSWMGSDTIVSAASIVFTTSTTSSAWQIAFKEKSSSFQRRSLTL